MGFRSSDYATDYSPDNKFGPVADGTYDCVIKNAYIKDLKTSADQISSEAINYLSEVGDDGVRNGTIKEGDPSKNVRVVFEVEGGQFSGKQFQAYFLFYHSRVDSLRQGRKWLGIMSTAANRPDWDDPMELTGARLKVRVETVRKEWGEVVQPKQYWPIEGKPERRNPQPPPPPEQGTFNDDDIPF